MYNNFSIDSEDNGSVSGTLGSYKITSNFCKYYQKAM